MYTLCICGEKWQNKLTIQPLAAEPGEELWYTWVQPIVFDEIEMILKGFNCQKVVKFFNLVESA
jgi:hypothetical protein